MQPQHDRLAVRTVLHELTALRHTAVARQQQCQVREDVWANRGKEEAYNRALELVREHLCVA